MMESYSILNISRETILAFKSCFDVNGSPKSTEKIQWQFLDSPVGTQLVDIAIDDEKEKVAAVYAVFPVKFKVQKNTVVGCQSLDTMTDKEYRGKGLFVKLAKDVYQKAQESGIKLVYGFPNGNSIHGFTKKLGWKTLDPVPFLIKPINTAYFTKKKKTLSWFPNVKIAFSSKISANITIRTTNEFPDAVNEIWNKFSKNLRMGIDRTKEYLEWRYLAKPDEHYRVAHAYTKSGDYIGFIIYCVKGKHGGRIGYIMEYLYDPAFSNEAKNLLFHAQNELIREDADCILAWCFEHSENYLNYKTGGFYTLPEKFRPIELHFGARSFDKTLDETVYDRKSWYLSYSDSDTV